MDTWLIEIRGKQYPTHHKKKHDNKETHLAANILKLEQNLKEDNLQELEKLKLELTEFRQTKVKGAVIRSRATNLLEGEKPTKYFCSLETHNNLSKIIPRLETSEGHKLTDKKEILKEAESFYKNLYCNKDDPLSEIKLNVYLKAQIYQN